MFPIPDSQGPHHRLRRPRADVRRAGQISELAGDRALPQGQRALQFRARPQGHAEGRHGDRRRGLYGRDRAGAGRLRERRRAARHRAHREPARAVVAHVGRAGAVLRRRPGRAEGGVAGRRHGAAADPGRAARCASRCCRRARIPTIWSRPTVRTRSARCSPRRGRSPTCCGCARPRAACSTRRSGGRIWKRRCASLTRRIRDESVRYHYQQEMRDRVHAFFGAQRGRPFDKRRTAGRARQAAGQGGQWARGGAAGGRLAVSESLARSAMVKRAGSLMPLREAVIVVALVNHPQLVEENFDQIESLDLSHSELRALHSAIIDAHAHGNAGDRLATIETIARRRPRRCLGARGRADPPRPHVAGAGGGRARRCPRRFRPGAALAAQRRNAT